VTRENVESHSWVTKTVWQRIPGRRARNSKTPTTINVQWLQSTTRNENLPNLQYICSLKYTKYRLQYKVRHVKTLSRIIMHSRNRSTDCSRCNEMSFEAYSQTSETKHQSVWLYIGSYSVIDSGQQESHNVRDKYRN